MGKPINLNREWRFHPGDDPAADFMAYDDGVWRTVPLWAQVSLAQK